MAFHAGQRVVFLDRDDPIEKWFHAASITNGICMHLNAKLETGAKRPITGRVLRIRVENDGKSVSIDFRPDGWVLPEAVWPNGFQTESKYFSPYPEDGETMAGLITDPQGRLVSEEVIREAVEKRLGRLKERAARE